MKLPTPGYAAAEPSAATFGFGQHRVDPLFGGDDVGERDAAEAAVVRSCASVLGKGIPREEPQGARATVRGRPIHIISGRG